MPSFDLGLLLSGRYHDWLLAGFASSLELAAATFVFALPLGIAVALLRLSPLRLLRGFAWTWVEGIRNIPLLAHLLFWYFAAPELLPDAVKEWLYRGNVEFLSAIVALTLYTSAYIAEDVRSGIRAVPGQQLEAAQALGFRFVPAMRHIVLPQALRITVPPLISRTLSLWKDTSVATVVGVGEMMYQAARVESASFRSFEAFAFTTSAYLMVSLAITALAAWVQHRYPPRTH